MPGPGPGPIGRGGSLPGTAVAGLLDNTESLGETGQIALDRIAELLSPNNLDAFRGRAEGVNTLPSELSALPAAAPEEPTAVLPTLKRGAGRPGQGGGAELSRKILGGRAEGL